MLEVNGNSMIDAGIQSRDMLLVEQGQLVDCRQLRLLKGVWSSPGAWRAQHLVTDKLA